MEMETVVRFGFGFVYEDGGGRRTSLWVLRLLVIWSGILNVVGCLDGWMDG